MERIAGRNREPHSKDRRKQGASLAINKNAVNAVQEELWIVS